MSKWIVVADIVQIGGCCVHCVTVGSMSSFHGDHFQGLVSPFLSAISDIKPLRCYLNEHALPTVIIASNTNYNFLKRINAIVSDPISG